MKYRPAILFAAALVLGAYVAFQLRGVLLLIYVSVLFAAVLAPAVEWLRSFRMGSWRLGRGLAIFLIFTLVITAVTLFLVFALPPVFHDLQAFASEAPRRIGRWLERLRTLPYVNGFDPAQLQSYAAEVLGGLLGFFRGLAAGVFVFISWLILTAYFVIDGRRAFDWTLSLFPADNRYRLRATLLRAQDRMRHWLLGQFALMLILGTYSLVVFTIIDLRYSFALAVFAGLANFIPILGPILTLIMAGLVAATQSLTKVVIVLIAYLVYQQVENAYLTPRIMQSAVKLRPLAVVIAAALGGTLAGVVGALVAVPSAAVAAVFLDEYVVHKDGQATILASAPAEPQHVEAQP